MAFVQKLLPYIYNVHVVIRIGWHSYMTYATSAYMYIIMFLNCIYPSRWMPIIITWGLGWHCFTCYHIPLLYCYVFVGKWAEWPTGRFSTETRIYSKTSNSGPSEKRTTSVQRTAHLPPIDFTIELIHFEPPRSGHLSTPNNGHWSVPNVP